MSNMTIKRAVDKEYSEVLEVQFGLWITGLFWSYDDLVTFEEYKEAFFILLEKLLVDKKAFLFPPECTIVKKYEKYIVPVKFQRDPGTFAPYVIWDDEPKKMVNYVRSIFPKDVEDINDDKMIMFWYGDCPSIGWFDPETGLIVAS